MDFKERRRLANAESLPEFKGTGLPGVERPGCHFPKNADGGTELPEAEGTKCIKDESLQFGRASDIGTAPTSRVFTRDYSKVGRSKGDTDLVSPALGNPLGL